MRRLKNWTITAESIKKGREGFLSYYQYLNSKSQHKNQDINELTTKKSAFNMIKKADTFNFIRKMGKGGRPSNYAWSIQLSYPFNIDDKTMKIIFQKNMKALLLYINELNELNLIDLEIDKIISDETVAVSHRGFKDNGEPLNNHIHIMVSRHFTKLNPITKKKSIVSIDLTKKKYLHAIKLINNQTINEVMGMEVMDYQIESKKIHKKRRSKYQYKLDNKLEEQASEADILLNEITEHIKVYKQWVNDNQKHDEEIPKELTRALQQVKNGNTKRARKSLNNFKAPE